MFLLMSGVCSFSRKHKESSLCNQQSALIGTIYFSAWCATVCYMYVQDVHYYNDRFSFSHVTSHLVQRFLDTSTDLCVNINVPNNAMSKLNSNCNLGIQKEKQEQKNPIVI